MFFKWGEEVFALAVAAIGEETLLVSVAASSEIAKSLLLFDLDPEQEEDENVVKEVAIDVKSSSRPTVTIAFCNG
jgi:DNA primase